MLILALETAGDVCSVAVSEGDRPLSRRSFRHERQLSERLPGEVEQILGENGADLGRVDAFAVGLGPGSFTGVRVGVTLAKTLAQVLNRRLVGISSLDALAAGVAAEEAEGALVIAAVAPTRRDEAVAAFYRPGSAAPLDPPAIVPYREIGERACRAAGSDGRVLLVGEVSEAVAQALKEDGQPVLALPSRAADASVIARLAWERLRRGESDDVLRLTPLYVTPPPVRGPDGVLLAPV